MRSIVSVECRTFLGSQPPRCNPIEIEHDSFDSLSDQVKNNFTCGRDLHFVVDSCDVEGVVYVTADNYAELGEQGTLKCLFAIFHRQVLYSDVIVYSFEGTGKLGIYQNWLRNLPHEDCTSLVAAIHETVLTFNVLCQVERIIDDTSGRPYNHILVDHTDESLKFISGQQGASDRGGKGARRIFLSDNALVFSKDADFYYNRSSYRTPYICLVVKPASTSIGSLYSTLANLDLRLKSICDQK